MKKVDIELYNFLKERECGIIPNYNSGNGVNAWVHLYHFDIEEFVNILNTRGYLDEIDEPNCILQQNTLCFIR